MAASGQTLSDRLNAFRYALAGQGLARTVCKATTLEVLAPKRKHMDYLIACTNEPNISIPQLANLLIERTQHSNWAVVFKALISIHHLMSYGNERFTQYLATSNHSFDLPDFLDRTTPQGYNMSSFVRRYAKYVDDKSISYRSLAIDLCKIKSGNDNALRTMNMDNLSKSIPILQKQFDSLLEFGAEPKDLNNGIIMSAFRLLYKDLVRIYVAYQEAIINLLERYFKLSRKKTREALDMYKNYLARMDKVDSFLRVVEAVELDKSEMPDLTNSPGSIVKLLEQHLAQLEARKKGTASACDQDEPEKGSPIGEQQQQQQTGELSPEPGDQKQAAVVVRRESCGPPETELAAAEPAPDTGANNKPHEPPPKPARPSPRASPAVSPKSSPVAAAKPAPPRPPPGSAPSSKQPGSAATSTEPTKRGPPERPAKPPSRPPPPSGAPASPSPDKADRRAAEAKNVPTSSTPHPAPPHPPPPNHQPHQHAAPHHHVSPTSPADTAATDEAANSSNSQPPVVARELNGESEAPAETQPAPVEPGEPAPDEQQTGSSCGSTVNAGDTSLAHSHPLAQEAPREADQTAGHVQLNNVNHLPAENGFEEELPSPPPALEEAEEEQQEQAVGAPVEDLEVAAGEQVAQQPAVDLPEPVVNGESSRDEQTD